MTRLVSERRGAGLCTRSRSRQAKRRAPARYPLNNGSANGPLRAFLPEYRLAFEPLLKPIRDARILRHEGGLLVVDKPSGMPVHGGDETLAGDLVWRLAACGLPR